MDGTQFWLIGSVGACVLLALWVWPARRREIGVAATCLADERSRYAYARRRFLSHLVLDLLITLLATALVTPWGGPGEVPGVERVLSMLAVVACGMWAQSRLTRWWVRSPRPEARR